jgi:tetratricopeptide (TPR) repeat protein
LLAHHPQHAPTWQALGIAQLRQHLPAEAADSLERAISLGTDGASLRLELACALEQTDRWEEAVAQLRRALSLDPQLTEARINLAALLEKLDRPEEALACGQQGIAANPGHAVAHYNLGSILQSLGKLDEAIAAYSKAIELDGQFAVAYTNRGCCRLLQSNNTVGWPDYEWRLHTPQVRVAAYAQPRWNGQSLLGKTLLVHGEQGVGDEILFASCLPEVVTRVEKCVLVCDPRLAKFMARSFPAITVVGHPRQAGGPLPPLPVPIDFQIPIGSLPMHLRTDANSYPTRKRFLLADPQKKQQWRKRLEALGPGLKVGISWRGGGTWEERRKRTTTLDQWKPLFAVSGVHFINLQHGASKAELSALQALATNHHNLSNTRPTIHHFEEADPLGNLDEFAAKVAALDLVISVGNTTVHVAGALGVPTWCLLPQVPQWRWEQEGETCRWYSSVQLLRQFQRGDWDALLCEAARRLQELLGNNHLGERIKATNITARRPLPLNSNDNIPPKPATAAGIIPASPKTPPTPAPPQPADPSICLAEATRLFNENRFEQAGHLAEPILAADAGNIVALRICGVAARKAQQSEHSLELLLRAIKLAPKHPVLQFELGLTYFELERHREAYNCYLKAAELNPSFQPATVNLSALLEQQERYEEAMVWARKAAQLKPDCPLAHYNLANQLRECGHVRRAVEHYQTAIRLQPAYTRAKWNLAICHVLLGQFAEAWPLHEIRDEAEEVKLDKYTQPRWDGSSLAGKSIVVHAEQGIGDEVLFASCFPDVIAQAAKTVLVCEPRLVKLFARSFPQATVYGWARRKDWSPMPLSEPVDFQIPAGSLPLHFRRAAENFPQRDHFLAANAKSIGVWRRRFSELGPGLKIGISWRAGGKANEGRKRTITLADWREILQAPGVQFINLQYGDVNEDIAQAERDLGIHIHDWEQGDPLVDMDAYAAKIAALDLVISVGNATVHLAGALGTAAWTLLPRVPSWRWLVTGDVSPWYASVRLFRQPRRSQWEPVLQQVAARLQEVANVSAAGNSPMAVAERIRSVLPQNEPPEQCPLQPPNKPGKAWLDANQLNCRQPLQVIEALLEQAERAYQHREFSAAEKLYREILQITPRHMPAHARLGMIAQETGCFDAAVRCFRRALNIVEPHAVNHTHLAAALTDAGRFAEALQHARRALELDPQLPLARRELGRALNRAGNHAAAIDILRKSLRTLPDDVSTMIALGQSLSAAGQLDEAQELLRQAIQRSPAAPPLRVALGRLLIEDQCVKAAEECFRTAIELQPTDGEAHYELARLLAAQGQTESAIAAARQSLKHAPQFVPAMLHLGTLLQKQGSHDEAESLYRRAVQQHPENFEPHHALAAVLVQLERFEEARTHFDSALRLRPDDAAIHAERACLLLQTEHFSEGWDEHEWRLPSGRTTRFGAQLKQPQWDGSALATQTILLHGEQHLDDEIMFATCYPDVLRQARGCALVCDARLERLFRRSFPQATVFGVPQGSEHQWRLPSGVSIDVHCPAGTLPKHLRRSADTFPRQDQLLTADPERIAAWRQRWEKLGSGLKIGISWRASEGRNPSASIPLAAWQPLLSAPGAHWINLQAGSYRQELAQVAAEQSITIHDDPAADRQYDLDNLAATIASLDAVITVDNTTAHLAGALGVRTCVVLPQPVDWRWLTQRDDSAWYQSVRLFRQNRLQPLGELFRQLREELLKRRLRLDELSKRGPSHGPHWSRVHAHGNTPQLPSG